MSKHIPPTLGAQSFNCPRCGAFAHQDWYRVSVRKTDKVHPYGPHVLENIDKRLYDIKSANYSGEHNGEIERLNNLRNRVVLILEDDLFVSNIDHNNYVYDVENLFGSLCLSCKRISLWLRDRLLFPTDSEAPPVNRDLPEAVKSLYSQAGQIASISPPAAAALLRVCVEKIVMDLGGDPKLKLNDNIGQLFKDGKLPASVKQACDLVRLYGNEAAHTGEILLNDTTADVQALFGLINYIGQNQYTEPKALKAFYGQLPEGKRLAIEKRDGKNP